MFLYTPPQQSKKPPFQKKTQQDPKKVAKIKEVLEVQGGAEVSNEEENIAKFYVQDF